MPSFSLLFWLVKFFCSWLESLHIFSLVYMFDKSYYGVNK